MANSEDESGSPPPAGSTAPRTPKLPKGAPAQPSVDLIRFKEFASVAKVPEREHLTNDNWYNWKERMSRVFISCAIIGYIKGTIKRPDKANDSEGNRNWLMNDNWVQQVIMNNITDGQMSHVRSKKTSKDMFTALYSTHESKANQSVNQILTLLNNTKASETDNLPDHLDVLKTYRDRLNNFGNRNFHMGDDQFKAIISASLPDS